MFEARNARGEYVGEVGAGRWIRIDWKRRYVELGGDLSRWDQKSPDPRRMGKMKKQQSSEQKNDALGGNRLNEEEGRERERERIENERREREKEEDAYEVRWPNRRDRRRM